MVFLMACLVFASLALAACGPTTINLPEDVSVNVPTALPGVTLEVPTQPPAEPPVQGTAVVPVTGNGQEGNNTIVVWGVGGLVALLLIIGVIALLMRPAVVEGPGPTVIERTTEVHTEHRDDLP
jgi:hypothetical protein